MKRKYNLLIGERTAEIIKIEIGCAYPFEEIKIGSSKGRDLISGIPKITETIRKKSGKPSTNRSLLLLMQLKTLWKILRRNLPVILLTAASFLQVAEPSCKILTSSSEKKPDCL